MSAREKILARIRTRRGANTTTDATAREAVRAHIATHPQNPRPAVKWDAVVRFREEALKLATTIDEIDSLSAAPVAVARYLGERQLPRQAVCWPAFAALNWAAAGIKIAVRPTQEGDLVGITGSFCAIAETGTVVMLSGPQTPAAASLLPETHIAIIEKSRIVPGMEEAWQRVRAEQRVLPRAVNFISGPSRTADIEQTVTLGAHGPYRVHILLVGNAF